MNSNKLVKKDIGTNRKKWQEVCTKHSQKRKSEWPIKHGNTKYISNH